MNKILAEGSSQNITVVNGKVIDNNNSSFKVKGNNSKFDIDIMNNNDGILIRELNKKEIVKLLKNDKRDKSMSLIDRLKKFSIQEGKVKNRRRTRKRSNKKKSQREKREGRKRTRSRRGD
jgi:hypothetical protein